MPDTSGSPCMPLVPFKLLPQCWSSEGMSLSKYMCGPFADTAWDSSSSFYQFKLCWFLQPEVMESYLPGTGTLGWGFRVGLGTSLQRYPSQIFIHHTWVWDQPVPHLLISVSPTTLDGCCFFTSIVVGLPFNSISDGSEWWLFYSLVVILMWLCEKVSCIYLCCHLDPKSHWINESWH